MNNSNINFFFIFVLNILYIFFLKDFEVRNEFYAEIATDFYLTSIQDLDYLTYFLQEHSGYLAIPQRAIILIIRAIIGDVNLPFYLDILSIIFISAFCSTFCLNIFAQVVSNNFDRFLISFMIIPIKSIDTINFLSFSYYYLFSFSLFFYLILNKNQKLKIPNFLGLLFLLNKLVNVIFLPITILYSRRVSFQNYKSITLIISFLLLLATHAVYNFFYSVNISNDNFSLNLYRIKIFFNVLSIDNPYFTFLVFALPFIFIKEKNLKKFFIYLLINYLLIIIFFSISLSDQRLNSYSIIHLPNRWNINQYLIFIFFIGLLIIHLNINKFLKVLFILITMFVFENHLFSKTKESKIQMSQTVHAWNMQNKNNAGCYFIEPFWIIDAYKEIKCAVGSKNILLNPEVEDYNIIKTDNIFINFKFDDYLYIEDIGTYKNILNKKKIGNSKINGLILYLKPQEKFNLKIEYVIDGETYNENIKVRKNMINAVQLNFGKPVNHNENVSIKFNRDVYIYTSSNEIFLTSIYEYYN